jgi:hypothetical protein
MIVENCILAFSMFGQTTYCESGGTIDMHCCDVFGNPHGDWIGCIEGQLGTDGNISLDPLFCDLMGADLTLNASSPCAPDNSPAGCGLIGALPVGCGTTAISENPAPRARLRLTVRPNPVLHGATFTFGPVTHPLSLEIYDPSGRLVERLIPSGEVTWIPTDRAARGVYFARLKGEGTSETVKFVVLSR